MSCKCNTLLTDVKTDYPNIAEIVMKVQAQVKAEQLVKDKYQKDQDENFGIGILTGIILTGGIVFVLALFGVITI